MKIFERIRRTAARKKSVGRKAALALLLALLFVLTGCSLIGQPQNTGATGSQGTAAIDVGSDQLAVDFIDVGQGDCILIRQGSHNMLIDAGNNVDGKPVVAYLKSQGVQSLECVVGTHPHEDHIGGLDDVINALDVQKVILPRKTTTTKTFESVVSAIQSNGLKITAVKAGDTFRLGDAQLQVLSCEAVSGSDLNQWSVVLRLTFGDASFLFTGDAQKANEKGMLDSGLNLSADILKVGHHGSHTSSGSVFLDAVSPAQAIISCGEDNDYGHPHKEVVEALQQRDVEILRTDKLGSIRVVTGGQRYDITYFDTATDG